MSRSVIGYCQEEKNEERTAEDPSPGRILQRGMHDYRWAPPELHRLGSQTDV